MKTILNCFWMDLKLLHLIKIKSRSSPWLPTSMLDWRCKLVSKKELITMLKVHHWWPMDWEQTFVRFGSWLWSTSSNQKQDQVQVLKAYPNTTLYQLLYVAISFIFQKDGEKNRCHGWSVFIVIWLNRMSKQCLGIGIYLDWSWTYFWTWLWTSSGCSGLKECSCLLHWTGHACCTGHTNYAGCTFHACGSNSSYKGGPSVYCMFFATSISPLKRGRWGGINSCVVGTVGRSCLAAMLAGLVFFWPAEIKDLAFFLAGWQLQRTPAACQWWWSSAHCNIEGISWLLESASWQLYLWEVN